MIRGFAKRNCAVEASAFKKEYSNYLLVVSNYWEINLHNYDLSI